ncbi:MAG: DNA-deoxyinosine glycosylase [Lachnospiraceae bacterium]|nr:DNA-deoxyinosine glycosylase [Lachnospiraceae bacterium]
MIEKNNYTHVRHGFEPLYDSFSNILILGTMPSVKSREQNFYYGHPRNRFWKLLAALYNDTVPETIDEKKAFLHRRHIALWDVISECDIIGSSDSSIKNVVPADISVILNSADIRCIYANGTKAYDLYMKYAYGMTKREIVKLPSTSPANAAFQMDRLIHAWGIIL